jgi:integrase
VTVKKMGRPCTIDRSYAEDKYVKKWLVGVNEGTAKNYIKTFKTWLDFIKMSPTEQIELRLKQLQSTDLTERQFFETKWREFKAYLEQTKDTDSTVKSYLKTVASFFSRNFGKRFGLSLNRGDWISNKPQPIKALEWIPSQAEIKQLYTHASLPHKCTLLTLYHTGLSEIDVSELRIEHFPTLYTAKETEHVFFMKYREKSTILTATCLSFEVVHDLREMLAERGNPKEGYLFISQTKGKSEEKPITVHGIQTSLKKLVAKVFGTEKAKEFETRHLRDSYHSALVSAGIEGKIGLAMMGHNIVGSEGKYAIDREDVKKAYERLFPHVSINGLQSRHDIAVLKTEKQEQAKEIETLKTALVDSQNKLTSLEKTNEVLREKIAELESGQSSISKRVTDMDARLTYYEKHGKRKPIITDSTYGR